MFAAGALLDLDEFTRQAVRYAPKVALAFAVLVAGALFTRIVRAAVRGALRRANVRPAAAHFGARVVALASWALVIPIVFSILQLQGAAIGLSGILALIGAAAVASAGGITNDIISGFFLAADPDIDVGYRIQTAGVQGVVREIDFRKTRIVDDEGRLHVLPNRFVENGEWIVLRRE